MAQAEPVVALSLRLDEAAIALHGNTMNVQLQISAAAVEEVALLQQALNSILQSTSSQRSGLDVAKGDAHDALVFG